MDPSIEAGVLACILTIVFTGIGALGFSRITGGLGRAAGPVRAGLSRLGGGKWVDSATREGDIAAVNTWTALTSFGASAVGEVSVPTKARFLGGIEISTAFDVTSTAAVYKLLSAIRLSGNGLKNGGMYRFLGQVGTHVQVNAFSAMSYHMVRQIPCRIEVSPGDKITVEGAMLAEDAGDVTMAVTLHWFDGDPGDGCVDSDARNTNITAVDTPTAQTALGADTLGNFKVPSFASRIISIGTAIAVDFAAGAAAQRAIGALQLTGSGLKSGGSYQCQTASYAYSAQGAAGDGLGGVVTDHPVDLEVNGGDEIGANAMMIGEDAGDLDFATEIQYGG